MTDLSFYVFSFILRCKGHVPFTILECEFVDGLRRLPLVRQPDQEASVESFTHISGSSEKKKWDVVLESIRQEIISQNQQLRSDPVQQLEFYVFLYDFTLRHNEEKEETRRCIASELWKMFFFVPASPSCSPESTSPFLFYKAFSRFGSWLEFLQLPFFWRDEDIQRLMQTEIEEELGFEPHNEELVGGHVISADLWHQLYLFSDVLSYEHHDKCGSWPNAIDDFVTYFSQKKNEF